MANGNVIGLLNKVAPMEPLDASKIVPPKVKPSQRDIELSEMRELGELENSFHSLFGSNGPTWEEIASQRKERARELREAILAVKEGLTGRTSDGPTLRRLARAEVELEGIIRLASIAETLAAANVRARQEFERDLMPRLKELRQKAALRQRDPLEVLGSAVSAARITAKATRL